MTNPIDISKIKPGDEVTVMFKVARNLKSGVIVKSDGEPEELFVEEMRIASHTPDSYKPKVGDRVTWGSGLIVYDLLAENGGNFWLRRIDYPNSYVTLNPPSMPDIRKSD